MIFLDLSTDGVWPVLLVCSRANEFAFRAGAADITAIGALHGILGAVNKFGFRRRFRAFGKFTFGAGPAHITSIRALLGF